MRVEESRAARALMLWASGWSASFHSRVITAAALPGRNSLARHMKRVESCRIPSVKDHSDVSHIILGPTPYAARRSR